MVVASRRYDRAGSLDFAWIIISRVDTEFPEPPATMARCRTRRPSHVISHVGRASCSLYHSSRDGCAQGLDHRRGPANHGTERRLALLHAYLCPSSLRMCAPSSTPAASQDSTSKENGRAASMLRQDNRLRALLYLLDEPRRVGAKRDHGLHIAARFQLRHETSREGCVGTETYRPSLITKEAGHAHTAKVHVQRSNKMRVQRPVHVLPPLTQRASLTTLPPCRERGGEIHRSTTDQPAAA